VTDPSRAPELPEHYFRHEFGRLVSVLTRRFGVHRLELCEDAAQTALLRALRSWPEQGLPGNKGGWLYRVALNELLGSLRSEKRIELTADDPVRIADDEDGEEPVYLESEIRDDQLRLLFVCGDPAIPRESQIVLALKTLCGFSTGEIALRLFQSEDAVHKRLQRARASLREKREELEIPGGPELESRLPAVLQMLYLLFTEGYSSAQPDKLIRRELCDEAVRLGLLLAQHPRAAAPEADALVALMYLDAARFDARVDGAGGMLLLEEQDRSLYDKRWIQLGLSFLARAARGERLSRYHLEAGIAVEHCIAPSFAETRWDEIARLYELLDGVAPSPLNTLNRSIAIAEWKGPDAGLALLEELKPPAWLLGYYLWDATLGELYRRTGDRQRAVSHLTRALEAAPSLAEKELIRRRIEASTSG
jgi:RNA polymerase sigma factor (sigma-70 family)